MTTKNRRKRIYVCSPYRGDEERNVRRAQLFCKDIVQQGHLPIAPHVYFTQFMSDSTPGERDAALAMGIEILALCDEMWVFGNRISAGMKGEIEAAQELGIPIMRVGEAVAEMTTTTVVEVTIACEDTKATAEELAKRIQEGIENAMRNGGMA
ncbi:MAG: DUF4406 domain-containing protein [Christensenellaceae bacterium]|jgi:hypothetical protein|nr:DUF4406 domain-containing protein [Christensenellaceae bacterium]